MIFDTVYLDIITIAFFIISIFILLINLYTIAKLRDEKKEISDNQQLFTILLGQMQGYFSRIDHGIDRIGSEEDKFYSVLDIHQREENKHLEAIEAKQSLHINKMERMIEIQKALLEQIKELPKRDLLEERLIPGLTQLAEYQKKESLGGTHTIELTLYEIQERIGKLEDLLGPELVNVSNDLKRGVNQNILLINQTFNEMNDTLLHRIEMLNSSSIQADRSKESVLALNGYIDLVHDNIKKVMDKSMDLHPIFKSLRSLIEHVESIQKDYIESKEDIHLLMGKLQQHEQKDLASLRNDVEGFLVDLKVEINESVEMLKKEFHLGQREVSDTVKTLAERSQIKKAYGIGE